MKFSIIIPVYSGPYNNENHFRGYTVQRAIKSVLNQQFTDWELILVDDGSKDGMTPQVCDKFAAQDSRITALHVPNAGRAIARNAGMDIAQGDWLCWLDSDDEYSSNYLKALDQATNQFPEYKIFNFGSIVYHDDWTSIREPFRPAEEGDGHEYFKSGGIGAGSFIFRRDLWASDAKYRIPDEASPYHFAAASKIDLHFAEDEPDIENPAGAFGDGVYRHGLSLGNPWGDDFCQFFYLTRDNKSKSLNQLLYIQYVRSTEDTSGACGQLYTYEDING